VAKLAWSPRAVREFDELCEFIAKDSPANAESIALQIRATSESIRDNPMLGGIVPEWESPNVRERLCQKIRIIYRVSNEQIEIITIVRGARRLPRRIPK
jgi:toxin ParE1/3/4